MPQLKVLISGAGIAGNALALLLAKLGHSVTVVERFPLLRTNGLQVDLRGHGIEILKRMGLEPAFRTKLCPEQGTQMVDRSGKRRGFFPANTSGEGPQSFTTEYEIMRGDFCRIMYDANKDRVKYVFGTWIESFEQLDNHVDVIFSNGQSEQYDLLVGADGVGSQTRKMLIGGPRPGAKDPTHPLGDQYVCYFTLPWPMKEDEEFIATVYMAPGKRGVMTRRQNPNQLQIYLGGSSDSKLLKAARGDVEKEKQAIAEIFQGAGWRTGEMIKSLPDAKDFYCERLAMIKLDSWRKGSVALVGDAAYCPSVQSGMGTSSSLIGAYILAGEIGRACGEANAESPSSQNTKNAVETALRAYESKFKPFMKDIQRGVKEESGMYPESQFGITLMNYATQLASLFKVDIARWMMDIKEDVKGWKLPLYEELE
ncbi:FAD/NAD(P)-binding domain-containing protein [Microthyrium microscopicum]|uniref:FAD/NAD(P)-binding domain-containing protein n=1 Tax=Microthyrium microscopicum TaxID=703497 RepID=A0A6A6TXW6_9PEZI|nr:FAD/NAD(P)-binding domain-containing protein [Microthyrium microscopicum]